MHRNATHNANHDTTPATHHVDAGALALRRRRGIAGVARHTFPTAEATGPDAR